MEVPLKLATFTLVLAIAVTLASCGGGDDELILATTTSTQDSGLLDVLIPEFEGQHGYDVKVIAVGSGQALRLGEEGEADVILAHSPAAEEDFIEAGFGIGRQPVMHNDFVIVGPPGDPAGIADLALASDALAAIAGTGSIFVSRGDDSGTHLKELSLWETADAQPGGSWYQETGQGMGATLTVASEKAAYTLSDRGTFLAQQDDLDLAILVEGDPALFNNYHVIVVNPERHSRVNTEGARAFAAFVTATETQDIIRDFGVEDYGEPLFVPDATVQR